MSKCKNLRVGQTCDTCKFVVLSMDGEDIWWYCNVDGDMPVLPDNATDAQRDEWDGQLGVWNKAHDRCSWHTCDAWEALHAKPLHCFGRSFDQTPRCLVCAYYVECQQAYKPEDAT